MSAGDDDRDLEPDNDAQREAFAFLQFEGATPASWPFPSPGDRIVDFVIEEELGRGGAGVVYRARQEPLGRAVALKLVPHGPSDVTPAYAQRLEREGRMLASVRHEAIPTVHAAGVVPGFHYVAVDLVDGTTLKDLIHARDERATIHPRPKDSGWLPFVLPVLHRVASALGAAHARGIVHRDVKPSNVLVDREGRPFLVDFGLAREDHETGVTMTTGFVGTPQYASPEQAKGEPLGAASDVFSFGVLAFEAVTGVDPFRGRGRTTHDRLQSVLVADPTWPSSPHVPRELRAVIEKCLEKRIDERYADARDVEAELGRLLRFEPVMVAPRGRIARAWRRARRRPAPVLLGSAAAVLLALAAIPATLLGYRNASIRDLEVRQQLSAAVRLFGQGQLEQHRIAVEKLLELPNPPLGAAGRRADLYLLRGDPAPAVALYERDLAAGSTAFADWLGCRVARAGARGERPDACLDGAPAPSNGRDFAILALHHEKRNETADALDAILHALELHPLCMEYRLLELRYLSRLGRTSKIADELEVACRMRPFETTLLCALARTRYRQGRFEEEEHLLRRALDSDTDNPRLLAELSVCQCRLFGREKALEVARRAYALAPRDPRVIDALGFNLISERRWDEALALVRSAEKEMPNEPHVLLRAGYLALRMKDLDEAERLSKQLFAIAERDDAWLAGALELRGDLQVARGSLGEALATFQRLQGLEPEIADWPFKVGTTLEKLNRIGEAEAAIDLALSLAPTEPDVLYAKARLLRAIGKPWEALLACSRALGRRADSGKTYYWMGYTWLDLGDPGAALRYAREAVKAHDDWMEAWNLKAQCEAETGALDDAAASYREVLARRPEPAARADFAEVLHRLGKDREALEEYRRARADDPKIASAWCGEGLVLLETSDPTLRDPAEALRLLLHARDLEPDRAEYRDYVAKAQALVSSR